MSQQQATSVMELNRVRETEGEKGRGGGVLTACQTRRKKSNMMISLNS